MRKNTLYWGLTALFCLALTLGAVTEFLEVPMQVTGMKALGYPVYILPFLGIAKVLGVAAILYGKQVRLKEWAYAGITFDLLGATYSHVMSSQIKEAVPALVLVILCLVTYNLWRSSQPAESRFRMQFNAEGATR